MGVYETAFIWLRLIMIPLGVVGNLLSLSVFARSSSTLRKNSISTYCSALALFDSYIILQFIVDFDQLVNDVYFPIRSNLACWLYFYLSICLSTIPGWILVAFSLDKLLNVQRTSLKIIKNKHFQWALVAGIVVFHFLLYSEVTVLLQLVTTNSSSSCSLSNMKYFNIFSIVYLLETALGPFGLMITTSVMIIVTIRKSRQTLERNGKLGASDGHRKSKETKFAISSLSFNLLFIITRLPLIVSFILTGYSMSLGPYFFQVANTLFYANSAFTLLIHLASNSIFRREFFALIRRNRIDPADFTYNTKNHSYRDDKSRHTVLVTLNRMPNVE